MISEVLIHSNTGEDVGLGHLVRCITLTDELLSRGIDTNLLLKTDGDAVTFAKSEDVDPTVTNPETLCGTILSASAEVVVIDSYSFTVEDFERIAGEKTLIVVDELGDRRIPANLVLNNNIYADKIDYPAADAVLRGPKYCMLREPFRELEHPNYQQPPESVLVTVGGSDLADSFTEIINLTASVANESIVHAVVGPYFESPGEAPNNVVYHRQPPNIHKLMWEAGVAVTGGGQTLYELAACGTPSVALTLGPDQMRNIDAFEEVGFCLTAGEPDDSNFKDRFQDDLETLYWESETRCGMGKTGLSLVDGKGVFRVAEHIAELL